LKGLSAAGVDATLVNPFCGSRKWLAVFAARPLVLKHINKTWATRWHRHWHEVALRENLVRQFHRRVPNAVLAQCPVSARAALDARQRVGGHFPITMVCHFNFSEATEWRDQGELSDDRTFNAVLSYEKSVMEAVDQVVYVSNWARRIVEEQRQIHPRASAVVWNGIDPNPPRSELGRRDLGLDATDLVFVNVGTLEPRKNQLALVRLFAGVMCEYPGAKLLLIGDGPDRATLQDEISRLQLDRSVRLLGFRRDVASVLPACDIYVHGALLENCPMVILEAARARLPIVASPTGGVSELLTVLNGVPLQLDDPDASMAALKPLLTDAEMRAARGGAARAAFERRFTRDAMLAEYLRILGISAHKTEAAS